MKLCEDGHDQICFDGRHCPCCELLKMNSGLEDKVYELEEKVNELKEGIANVKG